MPFVPSEPYTVEISRRNPTYLLFLVDQSASMAENFGTGGHRISKAQGVADAVNQLLENLTLKAAKEDGIRDYFYISVIGYGATVGPAFSGDLTGQAMVSLSTVTYAARLIDRTRRVGNGRDAYDEVVKVPVWFDPVSQGSTPMMTAFTVAGELLEKWLAQHPDCFPPIVINITDGEATDGDPVPAATHVKSMASSNGNVLVFNLHLSSRRDKPVYFPDQERNLADRFAKGLFAMSSEMPPPIMKTAAALGYNVAPGSRGFAFNADLVSVVSFLDVGTKRDEMLR